MVAWHTFVGLLQQGVQAWEVDYLTDFRLGNDGRLYWVVLVLLLSGCGLQLPTTTGEATFKEGKLASVRYVSTKAQSGFHAAYDPETKQIVINTDADSPRGYEDYLQAQAQIELKRLELLNKAFDVLKEGAPGP